MIHVYVPAPSTKRFDCGSFFRVRRCCFAAAAAAAVVLPFTCRGETGLLLVVEFGKMSHGRQLSIKLFGEMNQSTKFKNRVMKKHFAEYSIHKISSAATPFL